MHGGLALYQVALLAIEAMKIPGGSKLMLELLPKELRQRHVTSEAAIDLFVQVGRLTEEAVDRFAHILEEPNYRQQKESAEIVASFLYSDVRVLDPRYTQSKMTVLFYIALLRGIEVYTNSRLNIGIIPGLSF